MAYRRRSTSTSKAKLEDRLDSLTSVEPMFDLGGDLERTALANLVEEVENKRMIYNQTLGLADKLRDELDLLEREADDKAERLYAAIVATFGRDSLQYQQIGGVRKSKVKYTSSTSGASDDGTPLNDGTDGSVPDTDPPSMDQ